MVIVSLYYKPTFPHVHKDQIVAANISPGPYVFKGIFIRVQALNPTVKFYKHRLREARCLSQHHNFIKVAE